LQNSQVISERGKKKEKKKRKKEKKKKHNLVGLGTCLVIATEVGKLTNPTSCMDVNS